MIPDVLAAARTNSMSAKSREYFFLFKFSAALYDKPGFKMMLWRLLAENKSVLVAYQANALRPLKGKTPLHLVFYRRPNQD